MRRLIERMAAKLEKRIDEVQLVATRVQHDVKEVHHDSARISSLQEQQTDMMKTFSDHRLREVGP